VSTRWHLDDLCGRPASDELNAGNWFLRHPQVASWVNEFLFELSSFPRGKHDDWVDAWSQAAGELGRGLQHVQQRGERLPWSTVLVSITVAVVTVLVCA